MGLLVPYILITIMKDKLLIGSLIWFNRYFFGVGGFGIENGHTWCIVMEIENIVIGWDWMEDSRELG
jgi:hypothetical protein